MRFEDEIGTFSKEGTESKRVKLEDLGADEFATDLDLGFPENASTSSQVEMDRPATAVLFSWKISQSGFGCHGANVGAGASVAKAQASERVVDLGTSHGALRPP